MTFINYNDDDYPSHPRDDSYTGSDYEAPYSEQRWPGVIVVMGQGSNPTMPRYEPAADYIRRCKSFNDDELLPTPSDAAFLHRLGGESVPYWNNGSYFSRMERERHSFDTDYGSSADPRNPGLAAARSPFGASPRSRAGAYADYSYPSRMSYPEAPADATLVFSPHNMGGGRDSVV